MAWSWRKRKTIIPGMRVNFGKNGMSTTIGPRGASMTFGPNGTYLNTSIPGTGLYNRKRIDNHKTASKMTSETNLGCGSMILALIGGILWILLTLLIFITFFIYNCSYWWLGVVFCAITIGTHLFAKKIYSTKSKKDVNKKTQSPVVESASTPTVVPTISVSKQNEITEDYFNDVFTLVILLMKDYHDILNLKSINSLLDSIDIKYKLNGVEVSDNETKLSMLYWLDMTRCYLGLNNQVDLNNKTGLGLFTIVVHTLGGKFNSVNQITEAHSLYQTQVENIVRAMKDYLESGAISKDEFSVAMVLDSYPDLKKSYIIHLYRFASIAAKADNVVTEEEAEWLANIMKQMEIKYNHSNRNHDDSISKTTSTPKRVSALSATKELKSLIGLSSVKEEVETLTNFIKVQQARAAKGMKTASVSYHCVFTGNPGTGKTTVARILAKIYKKLGVVTKGHLVETDRAGLVAEYVGQTAVKTNKIIDSALDGVLFIDEAYSLVQGGQNDYGKEAIATLLKRMEDNRDRLIVIIAGYTKEMQDFINANPGLQSRFNRYIEFPDYSADDLFQIFEQQAEKCEYKITDAAATALKIYFENQVAHKDKNFGNGRFARNVFEKTMELQANRLAREISLSAEKLIEILPEDLPIIK